MAGGHCVIVSGWYGPVAVISGVSAVLRPGALAASMRPMGLLAPCSVVFRFADMMVSRGNVNVCEADDWTRVCAAGAGEAPADRLAFKFLSRSRLSHSSQSTSAA